MLLPTGVHFRRSAYGITSCKTLCSLLLFRCVAGHAGVLAPVQAWHSSTTLLLSPSTWQFGPQIFFIKNTLTKLISNKISSVIAANRQHNSESEWHLLEHKKITILFIVCSWLFICFLTLLGDQVSHRSDQHDLLLVGEGIALNMMHIFGRKRKGSCSLSLYSQS